MGKAARSKSRSARDIAPLPKVQDAERRARGAASFEAFCREYFPETFCLPWSDDHRTAIARIERATRVGGLFAYAMPRGSGKTSLINAAIMWALLYGLRKFVTVVASDGPAASEIIKTVKSELECNEALAGDFPEACYPVRRLDGIAQRAKGQLFKGQRTHVEWTDDRIVLPTIKGSICSAGIIQGTGITGRIRGMKFTRPDGQTVRPDLIVIDDPQTDESAKSPTQVAYREKIIKTAVLGLAGPGKEIAGFCPCTVIAPDDLADRLLDRTKHPQWQGERSKLLYGWPKREDLWEQYAKIRADAQRAGDKDAAAATDFYRTKQQAMDEGAKAAWPERRFPHELSATQHAMNLFYDSGRDAFLAEFQNEPPRAKDASEQALTEQKILDKATGRPRGVVPLEATRLVAMVDVQQDVLVYGVLALQDDFTGHVVDYGTYPDQKREIFTKSNLRRTLRQAENADGWEEGLKRGLDSLSTALLGREWKREDGSVAKIDRCLVDAHWGESTDLVRAFCRQSAFASVLTPSFGTFVGASSAPICERPRKEGERLGLNWRMPAPRPGQVRHVTFDANFWKTFFSGRVQQQAGGVGAFTIFGDAQDHRLAAQHWLAEYPVTVEGRGRRVMEWKLIPGRDNDLFDVFVGCCVAGSIAGTSLAAMPDHKPRPRQRVRFSELMRRKGGAGGGNNK